MTNFIDWFEIHDELTLEQQGFLEALFLHAPEWESWGMKDVDTLAFPFPHVLTIGFSVPDYIHKVCLRDLRVDFDAQGVRCGEDNRNYLEGFKGPIETFVGSPSECAGFVSQWLQREWLRPVDLHEWQGENSDWRHQQYVLPDTGQGLCWSGWKNVPEGDLGPPHRVVRVHPLPKP